jgi:hypothetical protein
MNEKMIFLPVVLQVLLTLYAYVLLAIEKSRAAKAGLVNEARRSLHDDAWPESVMKVNNNIRNQFELPVLFYVLVVIVWATGSAHAPAQVIAWLFALSRVAHLFVHTGSNYVPVRRGIFTFGFLMVTVLAVIAIAGLLSGSVSCISCRT